MLKLRSYLFNGYTWRPISGRVWLFWMSINMTLVVAGEILLFSLICWIFFFFMLKEYLQLTGCYFCGTCNDNKEETWRTCDNYSKIKGELKVSRTRNASYHYMVHRSSEWFAFSHIMLSLTEHVVVSKIITSLCCRLLWEMLLLECIYGHIFCFLQFAENQMLIHNFVTGFCNWLRG